MTASGGAPARAGDENGVLTVDLAGVRARLASDFPPFLEYARQHMAPLRARGEGAPRISARLFWHEGPPPNRLEAHPDLQGWDRADRDLYRRDRSLAWFRIDDFPDLHLRLTHDGDELTIVGHYYHRLSKTAGRDWLRRAVYRRSLPTLRRRRFTTLLYYLVYYPCFWWLEHRGLGHPIHAGGVQLPDGIVALAGPSGVGKSTLVAGLASDPTARLLSDTFLIQRGTSVRAVPEPLLLDQWSRGWLGSNADVLLPIPHRYSLGRGGFHWPDEQLVGGGEVRLLVFPQRAATHYVRPLPPQQAQGRIRAGDLIVNDVRRYWAYASVLEVLDPTPLVQAREQSLAELVNRVPAFEVGLTADVPRPVMVGLINGLLQRETAGGASISASA
ncbi:hypothetical protein KF840_18195 [bacterium]|nr:hypothetical protein [bacterium]